MSLLLPTWKGQGEERWEALSAMGPSTSYLPFSYVQAVVTARRGAVMMRRVLIRAGRDGPFGQCPLEEDDRE